MAVLIGLMVAFCFGTGDFLGGSAARRAPTLAVLALGQIVAFPIAITYALLFHADPTTADLVLGACSGALNVTALGLLLRGLATGRMGVVAPLTAVVASTIPVFWGLATGERPSALALVGAVLATTAAALIAREPGSTTAHLAAALPFALGAGIGFGVSFVMFAETSDTAGFFPVLTARVATLPIVVAVALLAVGRIAPRDVSDRRLAIGAGVFDVTASALQLVALRRGLTSIVAPIAALAPAFTVMLAWIVLAEKLDRSHVGGLALAMVALVLMAVG